MHNYIHISLSSVFSICIQSQMDYNIVGSTLIYALEHIFLENYILSNSNKDLITSANIGNLC